MLVKYYPGGDPNDSLNVLGYSSAQTLEAVLRRAGVVDAGAQGFVDLLEGVQRTLRAAGSWGLLYRSVRRAGSMASNTASMRAA